MDIALDPQVPPAEPSLASVIRTLLGIGWSWPQEARLGPWAPVIPVPFLSGHSLSFSKVRLPLPAALPLVLREALQCKWTELCGTGRCWGWDAQCGLW